MNILKIKFKLLAGMMMLSLPIQAKEQQGGGYMKYVYTIAIIAIANKIIPRAHKPKEVKNKKVTITTKPSKWLIMKEQDNKNQDLLKIPNPPGTKAHNTPVDDLKLSDNPFSIIDNKKENEE